MKRLGIVLAIASLFAACERIVELRPDAGSNASDGGPDAPDLLPDGGGLPPDASVHDGGSPDAIIDDAGIADAALPLDA